MAESNCWQEQPRIIDGRAGEWLAAECLEQMNTAVIRATLREWATQAEIGLSWFTEARS